MKSQIHDMHGPVMKEKRDEGKRRDPVTVQDGLVATNMSGDVLVTENTSVHS